MRAFDSPRLRWIPYDIELLRIAAAGRRGLARRLGAAVPLDWPSAELAFALEDMLEVFAGQPERLGWDGLVLHRGEGDGGLTLVGDMGLKGGPNRYGVAELGYGTARAWQSQGIATEMGRALLERAFQEPAVRQVKADCEFDNPASIRVLQKLGFQQTHREGRTLWWALDPPAGLGEPGATRR
jgi:ribosomal-protein-alanine N-acetyltransferase